MKAKESQSSVGEIQTAQTFPKVWVSEQDGTRRLHIGSDVIQSCMCIARPFDLESDYARKMMAFLLFRPHAERLLMIGLGGGSLAKFVHRRLPRAHITVVEINPRVIEVAREFFSLPPDDDRLRVIVGDGATHVAASPTGSYDVILVDGCDGNGPSGTLTSSEFYAACRAALNPDGVLVTNLWTMGDDVPEYTCMASNFSYFTLALPTPQGNLVTFGLRWGLAPLQWDELEARALSLEAEHGLEFVAFANRMRKPRLPSSDTPDGGRKDGRPERP